MYIVTVDNDPNDLIQLSELITTVFPGCRIERFTDPLLSAKHICNNQVDMVFLSDVMRPANGFKLMRVLRKNMPELPIVMLSKGDENRIDAIRAGFDGYLCKPIGEQELASVCGQMSG